MPRPRGQPPEVSDPARDPASGSDRSRDQAPSWKAVSSPDEHEDYPGQLLITRDTETIKAWAGARDATPILVGDQGGDRLDQLALDIPGQAARDEGTAASWDDWSRTFATSDLRFVFQEHTSEGDVSTYYRLDPSSREEGTGRDHDG